MKNLPRFSFFSLSQGGAQLLCLLLALGAPHQAAAQRGLRLGVKAGLNLATYAGGRTVGRPVSWQPGVAAGALLAYPLSGSSALQVEALYSQKGVRQSNYSHQYQASISSSRDNIYRASLAYLDVPVLYAFGPGSRGHGFFASVGPQLSLALSRREVVRPRGEAAGGGHEEMLSTDRRALRPVAAGYVAGVGYQLANGLGAEVRYSGDFTHVYRPSYEPGYLLPTGSRVYHRVLQFQVRYVFGAASRAGRPMPTPRPGPTTRYPEPALPTPAALDSLYRDPQVRRILHVLSILSRLDIRVAPQPVYVPSPSGPPAGRDTPSPRSRPRSRSERPAAD